MTPPTNEERLARIEATLEHLATKEDIQALKVWVLASSGTFVTGVVVAAVTWLVRLLS
jgi:hypothetical protein